MAGQIKSFETQYLQREIEGKSNVEIVVMLYDAGVKFMNRAMTAIDEKNIEQAHLNITKTQNIVNELSGMLDMKQGGDIAVNLFNLYSFISERLISANVKKDKDKIREALEIFSSLREAWVEIAKKDKEGTIEPEEQKKKRNLHLKKLQIFSKTTLLKTKKDTSHLV